jgi:hypothetical protein
VKAIHRIIMCGGAGARLSPALRDHCLKQLAPLFGERSSFQATVLRTGAPEFAVYWRSPTTAIAPASRGNLPTSRSRRCYVSSEGRSTSLLVVENLVVIADRDAILVADRRRRAEVKYAVERLRRSGRSEAISHSRVQRPWGWRQVPDRREGSRSSRLSTAMTSARTASSALITFMTDCETEDQPSAPMAAGPRHGGGFAHEAWRGRGISPDQPFVPKIRKTSADAMCNSQAKRAG